jgi:hypothetical protein
MRLEVYTTLPPIPMMMDLIIKIMVELLSVLALTTMEIKQGRFSECTVRYMLVMLDVLQRNSSGCWGGKTRYRVPSIDWIG